MLARISFFLGLLISIPSTAFSSKGLLAEPFFTRWDRAKYVFEGRVVDITPSLERVGGDFRPYENIKLKKARVIVSNVYKGDLRDRKEVDVFYVGSYAGMKESDKDLVAESFDGLLRKKESVLLYVREVDGKLLASVRYGYFPSYAKMFYEPESSAIAALKAGKSEKEIVELLWGGERWQYRKQLRENGKISR